MKNITISCIKWHLRSGSADLQSLQKEFAIIANFLQDNGLTKRVLLKNGELPSEDFGISTDDLTDKGVEIMTKPYNKWLRSIVNKGKDPSDISILVKALSTK